MQHANFQEILNKCFRTCGYECKQTILFHFNFFFCIFQLSHKNIIIHKIKKCSIFLQLLKQKIHLSLNRYIINNNAFKIIKTALQIRHILIAEKCQHKFCHSVVFFSIRYLMSTTRKHKRREVDLDMKTYRFLSIHIRCFIK